MNGNTGRPRIVKYVSARPAAGAQALAGGILAAPVSERRL